MASRSWHTATHASTVRTVPLVLALQGLGKVPFQFPKAGLTNGFSTFLFRIQVGAKHFAALLGASAYVAKATRLGRCTLPCMPRF